MQKKLITITTGGSGGHVFPAQAIADQLLKQGYNVCVLLDKRGAKYFNNSQSVPSTLKIKIILSLGLHSKSLFFILKMLSYLMIGFMQSLLYMIVNRPHVIISFGSYASIPVVLSGIILRIPIIMHEQNSYLGKAHKIFVKYAKYLLISFKNTHNIPSKIKPIFTGLPIRKQIMSTILNKKAKNLDLINSITLGIFGGSQGANIFAHSIPLAVSKLDEVDQARLKVFHQCREDLVKSTEKLWYNTKADFVVKNFFSNMDELLCNLDVVIARSGASSVYEFSCAGCFALYVPFAKAADNHQYMNAIYAQNELGAEILLEENFNVENIYKFLQHILSNKENVTKKQVIAKSNCKINALDEVLNLVKLI